MEPHFAFGGTHKGSCSDHDHIDNSLKMSSYMNVIEFDENIDRVMLKNMFVVMCVCLAIIYFRFYLNTCKKYI